MHKMKNLIKNIAFVFLLNTIGFSVYSQGVGLGKTRIIFDGKNKSDDISIINDDNRPYLIQAGITSMLEGEISPHFIIVPPIFRLDNKTTSSLRILIKDVDTLPEDRESLFYLNTKIIPATQKDEESSKLVIVTSFIIKVIYRPANINKPYDKDYEKISLENKGKQWFFNNPTPYHITLNKIIINNKPYDKSINLPPFSETDIFSETSIVDRSISQASWHIINDYGELSKSFIYKVLEK